MEHRIYEPNNFNYPNNEINIHLPVDSINDLKSAVKILNYEKNSNPLSFKDLHTPRSISTKRENEKMRKLE